MECFEKGRMIFLLHAAMGLPCSGARDKKATLCYSIAWIRSSSSLSSTVVAIVISY